VGVYSGVPFAHSRRTVGNGVRISNSGRDFTWVRLEMSFIFYFYIFSLVGIMQEKRDYFVVFITFFLFRNFFAFFQAVWVPLFPYFSIPSPLCFLVAAWNYRDDEKLFLIDMRFAFPPSNASSFCILNSPFRVLSCSMGNEKFIW
jgi:fatty acid desaturase